ncbi:MAG: T9SS type A sorting domain-containing protein [Ignavibacteria bacterium]|nr:T9SS type A sorting domain-containing protein [Ignavibacteria bacterium]
MQPMVLPTDSGYEMWYLGVKPPINIAGRDLIGYATSTDGITWTKWPTNPIIDTDPVWGYDYWNGTVLKFNDKYHLWYACFHSPPTQARPQIGYATSPVTVGVESPENEREIPTQFRLFQNYPNPFNPSTKLSYSITQSGLVALKVFDVLGTEIETLINEEKPLGTYELNWNAANLPSGVYFYRLQAGSFGQTRKMLLLK